MPRTWLTRGLTVWDMSTVIGGQYRGTFLVPVPSVLWKKSTATALAVLLFLNFWAVLGTFGKSFIIPKSRSLLSYLFGSNDYLNDLFLKHNTAIPSSSAIESFFFTGKDILKLKRRGALELDDLSQMVLFLKDNSE